MLASAQRIHLGCLDLGVKGCVAVADVEPQLSHLLLDLHDLETVAGRKGCA